MSKIYPHAFLVSIYLHAPKKILELTDLPSYIHRREFASSRSYHLRMTCRVVAHAVYVVLRYLNCHNVLVIICSEGRPHEAPNWPAASCSISRPDATRSFFFSIRCYLTYPGVGVLTHRQTWHHFTSGNILLIQLPLPPNLSLFSSKPVQRRFVSRCTRFETWPSYYTVLHFSMVRARIMP
jgi:hypothetical protein